MATTVNSVIQTQGDGHKAIHLDLTAGGADTSVTYTVGLQATSLAVPVCGVSSVNVTTGAVNVAAITYAPTTGVLTVPCANSDRIRATVFLMTS